MSNSDRILCKFFANGACLKGDHCEFAHDWTAPPNNICTYYQRGACAYGSRCRYDHVKPCRADSPPPASSSSILTKTLEPRFSSSVTAPRQPAWDPHPDYHASSDDDGVGDGDGEGEGDVFPEPRSPAHPADRVLCSFAAAGHCPRGAGCPHLHGDLCPTCGKHCLHPFSPKQRDDHSLTCSKMQKHLEALKRSQEIECSVCLERVLFKPRAADRKFGLLSECDHPFCISCIRVWRGTSPSSGMDVNSTLRACPICRKLSYFVIPSVIWYFSLEEKEEIVNSYKGKLKSIDCKYFDFGDGSCPFGTSCFYKHSYRDSTLEEVVLRHLGAADGETVIAKEIKLSEFLRNLQI